MNDHETHDEDHFVHEVRRQAERARRRQRLGFWQGLALTGAVGWMVALPAVGGAFLGRWLDAHLAMQPFSWTLTLLLLGLALGCLSAWRHVARTLQL